MWALTSRSVVLAAFAAALFAPFLLTEGARALDFLRLRALQGVQIESVPATIVLVLHAAGLPMDVTEVFGAIELSSPLAPLLSALSPLLIAVGRSQSRERMAGTGPFGCEGGTRSPPAHPYRTVHRMRTSPPAIRLPSCTRASPCCS